MLFVYLLGYFFLFKSEHRDGRHVIFTNNTWAYNLYYPLGGILHCGIIEKNKIYEMKCDDGGVRVECAERISGGAQDAYPSGETRSINRYKYRSNIGSSKIGWLCCTDDDIDVVVKYYLTIGYSLPIARAKNDMDVLMEREINNKKITIMAVRVESDAYERFLRKEVGISPDSIVKRNTTYIFTIE